MFRTIAIASLALSSLSSSLLAERTARADESRADDGSAPLAVDTSKENASLGMSLHRFQDDFGLGATFTTPSIAHWFRFTLGAGVAWYPYAQTASGAQTWDPFYHSRLVVEVGPGYLKGVPIRPYGFGGVEALLLPSSLSSNQIAFGGLGGFGMELAFMGPTRATGPVTYFMEFGGIGTGATATKIASDPSIASGFLISAGLRVYL